MLAKFRRLLCLLLILAAEGAIARETLVIGVEGLYYLPVSSFRERRLQLVTPGTCSTPSPETGATPSNTAACPCRACMPRSSRARWISSFPTTRTGSRINARAGGFTTATPWPPSSTAPARPPENRIDHPDQIRRLGNHGRLHALGVDGPDRGGPDPAISENTQPGRPGATGPGGTRGRRLCQRGGDQLPARPRAETSPAPWCSTRHCPTAVTIIICPASGARKS
jgi:hypothetical protein